MREKPNLLLVYGPPASGKTTIVREMCGREKIDYISVGEVTRREIAIRTDLGIELKDCLEKVVEYPPELIARVMEPHIEKSCQGNGTIILDGFPKYEQEVPFFIEIAKKNNITEAKVIHLKLSLGEALDRVKYRRICSACGDQITIRTIDENECGKCQGELQIRDDDKPEIITRRYGDYQNTVARTIESLNRYQRIEITEIDASKSVEDILNNLSYIFNICPGSSAERASV